MKARFQLLASAIAVVAAISRPAAAQLPTGAQVVHGNVAITQAGGAMNLQQASRNAVVNWQSFDIGAGNSVRLEQGGAHAAMLARVVGGDASQLLGSLKADGKLFLINPKGIVVGEGAVIDTAGFLGSTLDMTDAEFLANGAMTFRGESDAGIVNLGKIVAREGNVMLLAHTVKNAGEIEAANGKAALGAGTEVYGVPETGSFAIKLNLARSAAETGVDNTGTISAAQAELNAAGGSIYELAVNQSGVIRATGSEKINGRVLLTAAGGTIGVSGEVSARNVDGSGGEILVGGDFRGGNAEVANAGRTVITPTAKLNASATDVSAKAGRVIVWADDSTTFEGTLSAAGSDGGFAEVSGKRRLDFRPVSVFDLGKGGVLLLDPDALYVGTTDPGDAESFLAVSTLEGQLAASDVILETSTSWGDITFNAAVTWTTNHSLTLRSGNGIYLKADITGGVASALALYPGRSAIGAGEMGLPNIYGEASLSSEATITVGTLTYGVNSASDPGPGYTYDPASSGLFLVNGNIDVQTLEVDLSGGAAGINTEGSDNAIGTFRTTGTGALFGYIVDHHGDLDVTVNSANPGRGYLDIVTTGDLTLKSGSAISFGNPHSEPGIVSTVILASTGGAVVNQAGASVFGEYTRFFIYSSTTSATDKGGLTGDTADVFNHPYAGFEDFDDTLSRFFFSAASGSPILTYTADSFARDYGAPNPTFTYSVDGWDDDVTNDVTGAPALSATATQSSGVGDYTINIGLGSLVSSNYDFDFVTGTLTIERAPLTVTANDKTRRTHLANPEFDATFSGFVLDQDASALGGTLAFATGADETSSAGTYAITPSGLTSANYEISFVPGTLTLTDLSSLLITANDVSRTYGAANPAFTASYSGFVGGDTESAVTGLQFSTTATQASGVGSYTITPFGASADGYEISYASGTLTLERAALTIAVPSVSRYYGDENSFTVNFNGLVNNDTSSVVSGLSVSSPATVTSNVGNYAINGSGAAADNYSISYSPGSLTVTPAPLTVRIDDATRRYGDADPVFTYSIGGLKNNDSDGIVSVSNLSSLASADAGIGDYGIIGFPFASSPNYTVGPQVSGTLTITPRPLTITADDATRVYGDQNPTFTATFDGLASFDTPALFGDLNLTTQATQSSGVGNWGITFSTVSNRNYAITSQFGTLTITPAPLSIVIADAQRAYRQANPDFTYTLLGLKNDDTAGVVSGLALSTAATQLSDAGSYAITGSGTSLNYALTFVPGTLTVDRLSATIRVNHAGRIFGDSLTSFFASYAGFLPADLSLAQSGWFADDPDDPLLRPGSYAVAIEEASPEASAAILKNYDVNFVPGELTIARRVVEVKAVDVRSDTTAVSNAFPVEIFGLVPFGPSFTAVARSHVVNSAPPGNYPIMPVITEAVDMSVDELNHYYDFRMTPGVLTLVLPQVVKDVVDLNNPGVLLQNTTPPTLITDIVFENRTIEVKRDTITVSRNLGFLDYSTKPLTQTEYAAYFGSYIDDADTVRTALAAGYKSLLSGKGVKNSSYESMPEGARDLLAGWMDGSLELSALQALIAQGDANAIAAFSFILPGLVETTLSKDVDKMTSLDREVLGRLADLTEKRRSDTVRIARQKYEAMLETQRKKAEIGGMGTLFIGPGDFKNIVQSATEEALTTYVLASAGAVGGVGGTVAILAIPAIGNAIFVNSGVAVMAGASGGFAIAATMMVCLAVRAVQIDESIKNEKAYHDLMNSWRLGYEITSIGTLQSPEMSKDMKLSTMMLAIEMLSATP